MLAGHVLPSLVVYGGLRAGIDRGWCDPRLAHNPDVGPSYLAVAVAVAVAVAAAVGTVPGGRRLLARIAGVLIPPLVGKATFTDVGHVLAALTGAGAEGLLTTVRRRSGPRRCRPAAHG